MAHFAIEKPANACDAEVDLRSRKFYFVAYLARVLDIGNEVRDFSEIVIIDDAVRVWG